MSAAALSSKVSASPIGRLNASAEALKGQIEPFVLLDDFPTF
jgi:hypothetical protein